jgi:DNA replicative helicase MCM subunit Mcm2 (Cdc46/Mcm family)
MIPPYFSNTPFNVDGHTDENERLNPTKELAEYFIQHRTEDILNTINTLHIDIDLDEHPILQQILGETMEDFRNYLRTGVTLATVLMNYDRTDLRNIALRSKMIKNRIKINLNTPTNVTLSELTASDYEGEVVTFEAKVNNWSKIRTVTLRADYKCPDCGDIITRKFKPKIKDKCPEDNVPYEFFKPNESEDIRRIVFRETGDDFSEGRLPASISSDVYGKSVWETELSDKVIVTGIYRSVPLKLENGKISQEFIPTIQVISIQNQKTYNDEVPDMVLMKKFQDLEAEGKLVDAVTKGFAYNIYKKYNEKKAIICSIIGSQWIGQVGKGNPPMIHILFVGDPDTYKSTIMKYIINVTDNCVLADSTTVSNAGIKAIAVKMDDGRWSIMAGLLPEHHGGVVFLDEFGDMKADIYADLKAPMIDGWVSKHVAGEDFNGKAETGVLASMNPTEGVYDDNKTIYENLAKLGKPLITRFDLIVKFSTDFNKINDIEINKHFDTCDFLNGKPEGLLTDREIKLFLNYVKKLPIEITREALDRNTEFFNEINKKSVDNNNVETRTKNAIMKFAVALAKWHMSTKVTSIHVNEALELYKEALSTFGMHFDDGEFINESTLKKTEDGRRTAIRKAYDKLKDEHGYAFEDEIVTSACNTKCFVSRGQAEALMQTMRMEGKTNEKNKMIKIDWT